MAHCWFWQKSAHFGRHILFGIQTKNYFWSPVCGLGQLSGFEELKYTPLFFWPQVTNHEVKSKLLKNDFLYCVTARLLNFFMMLKNLRKKHKIFENGNLKFFIGTTYKLEIKKNPPEESKVATTVNFGNVEKTYACYPH